MFSLPVSSAKKKKKATAWQGTSFRHYLGLYFFYPLYYFCDFNEVIPPLGLSFLICRMGMTVTKSQPDRDCCKDPYKIMDVKGVPVSDRRVSNVRSGYKDHL